MRKSKNSKHNISSLTEKTFKFSFSVMNKSGSTFLLLLLLYLGIFLYSSTTAFCEEEVRNVEATGKAQIRHSDLAKARQQAIGIALRNAAADVAATLLSGVIDQNKPNFLAMKIISHAEQYIGSYKILSEVTQRYDYTVTIQATVSESSIRTELENMGVHNAREEKVKFHVLTGETGEISNLTEYHALLGKIKHTTGVRAVYPTTIAPGIIRLSVEYSGAGDMLMTRLRELGIRVDKTAVRKNEQTD